MMVEKASEMILRRLRDCAQQMARPEVRGGTIDRLVEACSSIESGVAADLLKAVTGKDHGLRLNPKINPSTIEKYVKSRGKTDKIWTGPTRVTIQKDPDLLAYVEAREDERSKPSLPKRPTSKRRQIEDAISLLPSIELRMELRHEIEAGRSAQRQLNILRAGLRKIPSIDVDFLLNDASTQHGANLKPSIGGTLQVMSDEERATLKSLVDRLSDPDELSRMGMELDNNRIRHKATHQSLIKPAEMIIMRRLVER